MVRVDGAETARSNPLDTLVTNRLEVFQIGAPYTDPTQPGGTIFLDDVYLGTAPPGC